MEIISNITSNNHYNYIKKILGDANELHITSPFLMESFDIFFDEIKGLGIKYISLTTTLKDNTPDLFKKANSLHSFCFNCIKYGIDYKVYIDNKLHGKIYIASLNGQPLQAIVTSANFTEAGLGYNHEWGIQINNPIQITTLINDISSLRSHALSKEEIANIISKIDKYSERIGLPKQPKFDLKVSDLVKHRLIETNSDVRFFIKPVGWSDRPFSINRTLSSDIEKLHFSKRRKPTAVRVGDILICYAVGTTKLLGYFEVIDEPKFLEDADRWPWEVSGRNLSLDYSKRWNTFNNTLSSVLNSYDTSLPVTYVGGNSLGALNFGADRIRLNENFAKHLIKIIDDSIKS
ncbi:NgoFVII family restriction endonuclease [Lysinibacillus capsici]|uniref:restriction endonuclease PLD domain-containing protein n=1 Tax=Lysinibacillus capsici TaxID=2115968 RepID=UPI0029DE5B26|nr:restriction endonuclease PLD domain-containing protein [Lysinibacillus capsici]WPK05466.1 NgoFVII family restriction endonuclease [Lysinibacillus capsici]